MMRDCCRLLMLGSGVVVLCCSAALAETAESDRLEEIVVTAQKRTEKLLDVPASISVISGDRLEQMQSVSLPDFAGYIPGLTVANGGSPGQNTLVIRGLSTGYSNATTGALVATYIDDVPVGSSTAAARGALYGLDLMPYDIERVEVLRGPQGTLYGADAMGGLVKYTLRTPDTTQLEARVGADTEHVDGSGGLEAGARASVNVPIIANTLAIRVSGFYRNNPGYIDNVGVGVKDANSSTESGGRATLLWQASDSLRVQATALAQNVSSADQTSVTLSGTTFKPVYGDQAHSTLFLEPFTQYLRDYALSIDWDLNFAKLTSSTSWSKLDSTTAEDATPGFGKYVPGVASALADFFLTDGVNKFTQEVRLASPTGQRLEWLLGGFFTREAGVQTENVPTYTTSYVPLPASDNILISDSSSVYKERAVFGNSTVKFTDQFDVGVGARYSENISAGCTEESAGLFGAGPAPCTSRPYSGVATWMANARYHLNTSSMLYLRWATGYRPGGGCTTCGNAKLEIPGIFYPDKVANYEAGFKGEYFDNRLQMDLAIFRIDWQRIQSQVINSLGFAYTGNGGDAKSTGFELSTSYQIAKGLSVRFTLDQTDAHLAQDAPGLGGIEGDQLPESPRWTASLAADYTHPITSNLSLNGGAGYRYRDKVNNQFGVPFPIPPQNIVDVYTGIAVNNVTARLFAKNLFNNRSYEGLLYVLDPTKPMFVPVQPLTIGLSVDYSIR